MASRWSDEECEVLRLAVITFMENNTDCKIDWEFVSDELSSVGFNRSSKACKNKYIQVKNSEFVKSYDVPENTPLESSNGPVESPTESDESPTESDESPTESDECCSETVTKSTSTSYSYSFSNSGGIVSSSASSSSSGGSSSSSSSSCCCSKDHVEINTESASSNKLFSILKKVKKIIKFK